MANPTIVNCPKNTWVKIATNVFDLTFWLRTNKEATGFYETHRDTGGAAPTDLSDAVQLKDVDSPQVFYKPVASDIYIYCKDTAGTVRID